MSAQRRRWSSARILALARALVTASALALFGGLCRAQAPQSPALTPAQTEQIDRVADSVLAATGAPSASIAVVKDGRIAYLHAYGMAKVAPPVPATPAMRYSIGSISKQFTAAALLLLQQDGKLNLDDHVSKYLPDLTRADEVTIRMLLTHTSGYQDYSPEDYLPQPMMQPTTTGHILDKWGKKPLDFDPGTKWQYSNTNYVIAARIIEIVTGQPYLQTIQQRILKPLGLNSAIDADTGMAMETDAGGYNRAALGPLRAAPHEGRGWMFGAFELAMTAEDLARWDISLIDRSLLKPESYDEMFTSAKLKDGPDTDKNADMDTHYGLGVEMKQIYGQSALEHSGETSGFESESVVFPGVRAAFVVLANEDAVPAASRIGVGIAQVLFSSAPPADQGPSKAEALALAVFRGLQAGRIDRGLLTPNLNAYFTPRTLNDFASSLKPLGAPNTFRQTYETQRAGMTFRAFAAKFPGRTLTVTELEMPDGKLEQYLVVPAE